MSYQVKQPKNAIATGFAQGLASQIPQENDRRRLAQGLESISQKKGLSPVQQLGQLATLPGITPQLIQSYTDLLKNQSIREGFKGKASQGPAQSESRSAIPKENFRDIEFANAMKKSKAPALEQGPIPGQPQVQQQNPLREQAQERNPWTPEQRNSVIDQLYNQFPNATFPEINAMAADIERRELETPLVEQRRDARSKEIQRDLEDRFKQKLETKLQKEGKAVYGDITGETIANAQRIMERQLRENPRASIDDVADNMSTKLLDLAKTKSQLNAFAAEGLANPLKKEQNLQKLKSYQKSFADTGNQEEYWNLLQSNFALSPQGAASIAYPRSKNLKSFISDSKRSNMHSGPEVTRKFASDIEKHLTPGDSLLAISRDMREKDPYFDQRSFFDQLRADRDSNNIRLSPLQERELNVGESEMFTTWGDLWTLPFFRGL